MSDSFLIKYGNLRAALDWCIEVSDAYVAPVARVGMAWLWMIRWGDFAEEALFLALVTCSVQGDRTSLSLDATA